MFKYLFPAILIVLLTFTLAFAQGTSPATSSEIVGIDLPSGAARVDDGHIPMEITQALEKLIAAGNGKVRRGNREVIAWTEGYRRSNAAGIVKKVTAGLQTSGWTYEVGAQDSELTVFTAIRSSPSKRAIVGFYTYSDEALVFAWIEMLAVTDDTPAMQTVAPARSSSGNSIAVNIPKNTTYVNALGSEMPAMPKFPALSPKPGRVRGYVKDASGKPLAGAAIGVRSTLIGGAYSGAQGKTDASGYYDFAIPRGVAHYYNAGYAIEYGEGLAALGLHPADGSVDSFASVDGAVENFVLLGHGITSRASLQENPRNAGTYYGGSIYVGYWVVSRSDASTYPKSIIEDEVVEIVLTPDGPLADGSAGRMIVVRKTAGFDSGYWVNNIPVGRYTINARLSSGKALKMTMHKPIGTPFGMSPAESSGTAALLFSPGSAQASMVSPAYGGWDPVSISVERP